MSLLALLAAGGSPGGPPRAPHVRTPALDDYTPTAVIEVPSPDPTGDFYHPDVIDTITGWSGRRYWMAFTPFSSEAEENPCIVASDDGTTWTVPSGLTNPIDPTPSTYNSDTELVLHQGLLHCLYREGGAGDLRYRTSGDGWRWSSEKLISFSGSGGVLSPSYVRRGSLWHMWFVTTDGKVYRTSASTLDGEWASPVECAVSMVPGYTAWHIDVIWHAGAYYGLIYAHDGPSEASTVVVGIVSGDGTEWGETTDVLMRPNSTFSQLYRATLQPAPDGFNVWVGATRAGAGGHRLGRSFIPAAEFGD